MRAKKKKRPPIDSASEQSRIMAAAFLEIKPPAYMKMFTRDIPFFNSIIEELPKAEWTDHTIELAAMLARTLSDLNQEQILLREEGVVLKTSKGYPFSNPRKKVVQEYAGTVLALRRSLSIHARAQGVNKDKIGKRRALGKAIEEMAEGLDDDLIARPKLN